MDFKLYAQEAAIRPTYELKALKKKLDTHIKLSSEAPSPELMVIQAELAAKVPANIYLNEDYGINEAFVENYRARIKALGITLE